MDLLVFLLLAASPLIVLACIRIGVVVWEAPSDRESKRFFVQARDGTASSAGAQPSEGWTEEEVWAALESFEESDYASPAYERHVFTTPGVAEGIAQVAALMERQDALSL
jgi:hypothetical protein